MVLWQLQENRRRFTNVVMDFNTCRMYFMGNHVMQRLLRASLRYHFKKTQHTNINTMDYKYILNPGRSEYAFWNEVLASSELTAETVQGDFYSIPPKYFMQGPSRNRLKSSGGRRFGE